MFKARVNQVVGGGTSTCKPPPPRAGDSPTAEASDLFQLGKQNPATPVLRKKGEQDINESVKPVPLVTGENGFSFLSQARLTPALPPTLLRWPGQPFPTLQPSQRSALQRVVIGGRSKGWSGDQGNPARKFPVAAALDFSVGSS